MVSQPLMLDLFPTGWEAVWVWLGSGTWCYRCISYSVHCHAWQRRKYYRWPSQSSGMRCHASRLHPVAGKWSDFSEHVWDVDLKLHSCSVTCQQPCSVRAMLSTPALGNCPQANVVSLTVFVTLSKCWKILCVLQPSNFQCKAKGSIKSAWPIVLAWPKGTRLQPVTTCSPLVLRVVGVSLLTCPLCLDSWPWCWGGCLR